MMYKTTNQMINSRIYTDMGAHRRLRVVVVGSTSGLGRAAAAALAARGLQFESTDTTFSISASDGVDIPAGFMAWPDEDRKCSGIQYGPVRKGKGGKPRRW